jgi:hypothetical protein
MVLVIVAPMSSLGGVSSFPGARRRTIWAFAAGVIAAARRRQRRRRLLLAFALVIAGTIGAGVANSPNGARHAPNPVGTPPPEPPLVAPASVLSRNPYMGVRCPQPNAISCDQIGLAVWLKRPAISVDATIAGQPVELDWFGEQRLLQGEGSRTAFDGYLNHAELTTRLHVKPTQGPSYDPVCNCRIGPTWYGADAPKPVVQLQVEYPNRTRVRTQLQVPLASGWG